MHSILSLQALEVQLKDSDVLYDSGDSTGPTCTIHSSISIFCSEAF